MAIQRIRLLGEPVLRARCSAVTQFNVPALRRIVRDLRDTLYDFKRRRGFGRGIAAPQIGVTQRIIFLHVEQPITLINPVITWRSKGMFSLWDDCFSFPDILVKLRRHRSVTVRYADEQGRTHVLHAQDSLSELLQHEIDHLNGILAVDRAINSRHIILREEWERRFRS